MTAMRWAVNLYDQNNILSISGECSTSDLTRIQSVFPKKLKMRLYLDAISICAKFSPVCRRYITNEQ